MYNSLPEDNMKLKKKNSHHPQHKSILEIYLECVHVYFRKSKNSPNNIFPV